MGRGGDCLEGSGSKLELFPLESKQEEEAEKGETKRRVRVRVKEDEG